MFESGGSLQERLVNFMYGVYGLMSIALGITAFTAFYISRIPNIQSTLFGSPLLVTLILIGQLILVFALSAFLQRLTFPMAFAMFLVYAISVGITTSIIFLVYTTASIVQTFVVASGMFGIMTIYGYLTNTDLTRMGNVLIMMLWGMILAVLINLFFQSPMADLIISGAGVIIFTLLTAYDTQKIKQIGAHLLGERELLSKVVVLGALTLYLDFINLFLFLLQFMGKRRD